MYSNYKNFERARYLLIRDFLKQKEISEMKMKCSEGTLFSGIFSAIISYVINNTLTVIMLKKSMDGTVLAPGDFDHHGTIKNDQTQLT